MLILVLLGLFMAETDAQYVLVLKNNQKMVLSQRPTIEGRFCYMVLADGTKSSLPAKMVDLERSDAYNKEMAERAAEEAALAAEKAKLAEEERAKHMAKGKDAVVKDTRLLKPHVRQGTSGMVSEGEKPEGEPKVRVWNQSSDEVFLTREEITMYPSRREVRITLGTNLFEALDLKVSMKVIFSDKAPVTLEQTVGTVKRGETVSVSFDVAREGEIVQSEYGFNYNTVQ